LRIPLDNNVPVGVRRFLPKHEVRTVVEMKWSPRLENGELLKAAEAEGFDLMITADQNIAHQQNLTGRKLAIFVIGSNVWPVVRGYELAIGAMVDEIMPGGLNFLEMPLPSKLSPGPETEE